MKRVIDKSDLECALERLYARRQFGIKLGLEPVQQMCELMGNPQLQYGVIHVAGTNGKGSICTTIASIVQASGVSVGLYTSPHLVRFNERIRINGVSLSDAELFAVLQACEAAAETVQQEQGHEVTFFEITTVLAFECFRRAGVKLAVIETGLGGRLDATNVVIPIVSVITRIAKDHAMHLGESLAEIAGEKAGIIKPGRPVVSSPQEEGVITVLQQKARDCRAPFVSAENSVSVERIKGDLHGQKIRYSTADGVSGTARYALLGDHQLENIGVALAAVELLFDALGVLLEPGVVKKGLEQVRWPGRCELLKENPCVIADAAHNPSGAKALADVLRRNDIKYAGIVLGMCDDKDVVGVVKQLSAIARRIWVVPIPNERSMPVERLAELAGRVCVDVVCAPVDEALDAAEAWAIQEALPVVVTGSIFLLGAVLPRYGAGI